MKEVKQTREQLEKRRDEIEKQLNLVNQDERIELDRRYGRTGDSNGTARSFRNDGGKFAKRIKLRRRKIGGNGRKLNRHQPILSGDFTDGGDQSFDFFKGCVTRASGANQTLIAES